MVVNSVWNGHRGKTEQLFIRNIGGLEIWVKNVWIENTNDYLSGGTGTLLGLFPNHFHHYLYPWKIMPNSVNYYGCETGPLWDVLYGASNDLTINGFNFDDVEISPGNQYNYVPFSQYPGPWTLPTLTSPGVNGEPFSLQGMDGEGMTDPNPFTHPNQGPKLYGYNLLDYYRIPKRFKLEPYALDNFNNQLGFNLGCFPRFPGQYTGKILVEYTYRTGVVLPSGYNELDVQTATFHLTLEVDKANIGEIDHTDVDDIFSIEGMEFGQGFYLEIF